MERDGLAALAGFFAGGHSLERGATVVLGEDAAHHARVRRLQVGSDVYLADGQGAQGAGSIASLAKKEIAITVDRVRQIPRSSEVHLLVPIADRDRMLWCAEKCTELGASSWRPVMWNRSRSVSPRGDGGAFAEKVRARMTSALIQAHAAWLPNIHEDATLDEALALLPGGGSRLALDASGDPIDGAPLIAPMTIAVGPEGGLEPAEVRRLTDASFRIVSLGANVLRFETAAVAALAIVRAKTNGV